MKDSDYAELAELAGSFIHEIKNHLSTLGLNLQLLAEDFQEPQSQRERRALDRIQRLQGECHRLVDVSNDFLRFARVKDLDRRPGDLAGVIEELVDFFAPTALQHNIEIKRYLPADLPPVSLDREMFKQALLNLLLNAQQAMPQGGEVTIQASCERVGELESDSAATGTPTPSLSHPPTPSLSHSPTVVLSVIDTGKGMAAEVAARAFRPFYSTRPAGTGLGLPTTRKIVEAHGGTIELQSEPGRGSKFTIRLPVAEGAEP